MIPFTLICIGLIIELVQYIPKNWVEKYIAYQVDPNINI